MELKKEIDRTEWYRLELRSQETQLFESFAMWSWSLGTTTGLIRVVIIFLV